MCKRICTFRVLGFNMFRAVWLLNFHWIMDFEEFNSKLHLQTWSGILAWSWRQLFFWRFLKFLPLYLPLRYLSSFWLLNWLLFLNFKKNTEVCLVSHLSSCGSCLTSQYLFQCYDILGLHNQSKQNAHF